MAITWTANTVAYDDATNLWFELAQDMFAILGGSTGNVMEYTPGTEAFSSLGDGSVPWSGDSTLDAGISVLQDGRVFVAGGRSYTTSDPLDATFLGAYDRFNQAFTWAASTALPVALGPVAQETLPDGRLFILGKGSSFTGVAYLGTVSGGAVSWATSTGTALSGSGTFPSIEILPDGRVLAVFGAYEMFFGTITGNAIGWAAATESGGTYDADGVLLAVAALGWPDSVLIGGGYNGSLSYPETNLDTVAGVAISGTSVTLTDFSPVQTPYPEKVGFFRLSDGKVLSVCYDPDLGKHDFALGVDADPPPPPSSRSITWTATGSDSSASDTLQPWVQLELNVFARFGTTDAVVATYNPGTEDFTFTAATAPPWAPSAGAVPGISKLADGRIFISGGSDLAETYIGTFFSNNFSWVTSTALPVGMTAHAQVVIPDGRLFILPMGAAFDGVVQLGTVSGNSVSWATATGTPLGAPTGSDGASAVVLPDGRILVVFSAYEMVFALVDGGEVTWVTASVRGGAYNPSAKYVSAATQGDGSVFIGGGFDDSASYPESQVNLGASCAISGTTVTLTDFDPLPALYPEIGVMFFRLSDGKVLATCTDLDTAEEAFALGEDSDPPVGSISPAAFAVSAGSSAAFGGAAIAYARTAWASVGSVEWATDDRSPIIEGGSVAAFRAPSPAALIAAGGSSTSFQMSHKVPFALYLRGTSRVSFKALFEKIVEIKMYGGSAAAFKSQPTVPGHLVCAGGSRATFKGGAFAAAAVDVSAASTTAMKSQTIAMAAIAAASSSAAAFLSLATNGGVLQLYCSSSSAFVGDFGTVNMPPAIGAAGTLHVFIRPQQISIEEFA